MCVLACEISFVRACLLEENKGAHGEYAPSQGGTLQLESRRLSLLNPRPRAPWRNEAYAKVGTSSPPSPLARMLVTAGHRSESSA